MSFLHSWLCKKNGGQCDWACGKVNDLGGPVIPGNSFRATSRILYHIAHSKHGKHETFISTSLLYVGPVSQTADQRGTGMIASSSTVRPHLGRAIRDLFRQLHAVWHGTEALQQSSKGSYSLLVSMAIIFRRIASGVPWLLSSTAVPMQLSHQC